MYVQMVTWRLKEQSPGYWGNPRELAQRLSAAAAPAMIAAGYTPIISFVLNQVEELTTVAVYEPPQAPIPADVHPDGSAAASAAFRAAQDAMIAAMDGIAEMITVIGAPGYPAIVP